MAKTSKRIAFDAHAFRMAGAAGFTQDAAEAIILTCGAKQVDKALLEYTTGYVAQWLAGAGCAISKAHWARAEILADSKASVGPDSKTVPAGKVKRTKAEHDAVRAGARRFNRKRAQLNVKAANTKGGARKREKAAPKVLANPKVDNAQSAHAHLLNMAKMMSGFVAKNRDNVSDAMSALVADFVGNVASLVK